MSDPLSILAGTIAIFDATVKGYRFARDIKNAGFERKEFEERLESVRLIERCIKQALEANHSIDPKWKTELGASNSASLLVGLNAVVIKMTEMLRKAGSKKHSLRDFLWHSRKKALGECFKNIDSYCSQINTFLSYAGLRETEQVHVEVVEIRRDLEREKIEAWVPAIDFYAVHQDFLDKAEISKLQFLESATFQTWSAGYLKKLRCFGDRGAGKTVLCSMIVDYMKRSPSISTPTLYLYIEKAPDVPHDVKNLVGSLLKQLMHFRIDSVSPIIRENWNKSKNETPSEQLVKMLFAEEAKTYKMVHVVIDGIDLLDTRTRDFVENTLLKTICPETLKLLTTSRQDVELAAYYKICDICKKDTELYLQCPDCGFAAPFNLCPDCYRAGRLCSRNPDHKPMVYPPTLDIEIRASKVDLQAYVKLIIMSQLPTKDDNADPAMNPVNAGGSRLGIECAEDPSLLDKIVGCVVENSEGKFLMAELYTKSLEDKLTKSEIEDALDDLNSHRLSLSDLIKKKYTNDIKKWIEGQGPSRAKQAFEILSIVYFAKRKLRFAEFQHALATKPKDSRCYNSKNEMRETDILKLTNGFITIGRDRDKVVRLADDRTLREYFDDTCDEWFENWGERDMAERCVRYLSFETFSSPSEVDELQAKEKKHSFLAYAVQHWGTHVVNAYAEVEDFVITFLKDSSRIQSYIQCAWELNTDETEKWDVRRTISPLHICAWFNLCHTISELGDNIDYDIREGTYGQTALMYACRRGHKDMIKLLLDRGASLNIMSDRGRTALFEAIVRPNHGLIDNKNIVDAMLNHRRYLEIDLNKTGHGCYERTALMVAIDQHTISSTGIALSILRLPNVDLNKQDSRGRTALSLAASKGNLNIINALLVFKGIEIDLQDVTGCTALMSAAERGHTKVVDALLHHGARPSLQDFSGASAALKAAEEGKKDVLECFVKFDVNLDILDKNGRTLMHGASENGRIEAMSLLANSTNYATSLAQKDKFGMTPLHSACRFAQLEAAKYLLEKGLDWTEEDSFERTAFEVACQYGHEALIELLEKQAQISGDDPRQRVGLEDLPTWSLVAQQRLELIKRAIASETANSSVKEPGTDRTIVHCAVRFCKGAIGPQILEAILDAEDVYLNEPDALKDTPLHIAVRQNCLACTKIILQFDPAYDEPDRFGLTPLDQACTDENYDIAAALVTAGATSVNTNTSLRRLIFQAAELKDDEVVKRLLAAGADRMVPDEYGRTIDMLVRRTGNTRLLKVVQSYPSSRFPHPKETEGAVTKMKFELPNIGQRGRLRRLAQT